MSNLAVLMLDPTNAELLDRVAPDVFDNQVDPRWRAEFVADPRHHLAMAIDADRVVGMASAVHYVHPDKAPELWINEVAVAWTHRGTGLGGQLVQRLCDRARELGCHEAWVLADRANTAATRMYAKAGGIEYPAPITMFEFKLDVGESGA